MIFYLDTNIVIYATSSNSPFARQAGVLLEKCFNEEISAVISTETIQEIIFYSQKNECLSQGLVICKTLFDNLPNLVAVNQDVIKIYLKLVSKNDCGVESRDYLHLAACLNSQIPYLVTEDKALQKTQVKGLKIISIKQALKIACNKSYIND